MDAWRALSEDLQRLQQRLTGFIASLTDGSTTLTTYVPDMDAVAARLMARLGTSPDVIVRRFRIGGTRAGLVCYLDNLVDVSIIDRDILRPVLQGADPAQDGLPVSHAAATQDWETLITGILAGHTAVCLEDLPEVWMVDTVKVPQRSIERPQTEMAIRGPQEAFNEVLATQLSQLRRRLATPHLVFDQLTVGTRYPVAVVIAYLDDVVNPALRDAVRARVTRIRAETIVNSTLVASYLRDHPGTLFPTVRNSERVDLVVWQLLSGKVAVLVDGDPFVLWGPATLCDFYRTSEDYTSAWYDASFIRAIRWLAWAFGVYLPALYIALTEVNPDLVPPPLVILTAGSHTGLPFTPIVEVLVMILIIEILREAALRLPKALGTTIGTVGAIVVGTAVVKAGFVSPQIIVVMTLTALSFFTAPSYDLTGTWRLVSWVILVSAFIYGVYGIVLATLGLTIKLVTETSFGVPYLTPLAPFRPADWVDTLWRAPWSAYTDRATTARTQRPPWNPPPDEAPDQVGLRAGQLDTNP